MIRATIPSSDPAGVAGRAPTHAATTSRPAMPRRRCPSSVTTRKPARRAAETAPGVSLFWLCELCANADSEGPFGPVLQGLANEGIIAPGRASSEERIAVGM